MRSNHNRPLLERGISRNAGKGEKGYHRRGSEAVVARVLFSFSAPRRGCLIDDLKSFKSILLRYHMKGFKNLTNKIMSKVLFLLSSWLFNRGRSQIRTALRSHPTKVFEP